MKRLRGRAILGKTHCADTNNDCTCCHAQAPSAASAQGTAEEKVKANPGSLGMSVAGKGQEVSNSRALDLKVLLSTPKEPSILKCH